MHLPHFLRPHEAKLFSSIQLNLDHTAVTIPVFQKTYEPGKHLLVTAGMDGDEYASIEAVYRLAEYYGNSHFKGTLTLIPIINIPGFRDEVSFNPVDRKYPKFQILGAPHGTATERLFHWLITSYATTATVWMDLHGGALTEQLIPFDWYYETGQKAVDAITLAIMSKRANHVHVYEHIAANSRSAHLAKHGCAFIISEAGAQGVRAESDILYHTRFVESVMSELEMISGTTKQSVSHPIRKIAFYTAPYSSLWYPAISAGQTVMPGQKLGQLYTYTREQSKILESHHAGIILWNKIGMSATARNTLVAIGLSGT